MRFIYRPSKYIITVASSRIEDHTCICRESVQTSGAVSDSLDDLRLSLMFCVLIFYILIVAGEILVVQSEPLTDTQQHVCLGTGNVFLLCEKKS